MERRAERKEQMDKLTEDGEAESFTVSATGIDMKSVTQNLIEAVSGTSVPAWGSFLISREVVRYFFYVCRRRTY